VWQSNGFWAGLAPNLYQLLAAAWQLLFPTASRFQISDQTRERVHIEKGAHGEGCASRRVHNEFAFDIEARMYVLLNTLGPDLLSTMCCIESIGSGVASIWQAHSLFTMFFCPFTICPCQWALELDLLLICVVQKCSGAGLALDR
jgi:hypothetical protein